VLADNLEVLAGVADDSIDLIYVDPPFNTGRRQTLESLRTVRDEADGDRVGFQGRRYRTLRLGTSSYLDIFDDYLAFLEPRLTEFHRVLKASGALRVHADWLRREAASAQKSVGREKVLSGAALRQRCRIRDTLRFFGTMPLPRVWVSNDD
jgi:DNA modification methylase